MAFTDDDKAVIRTIVTEVVRDSEERIVARINREVTDLADVNRLALDRLENHEQRLVKLEHAQA